jgi:serine/threonine protein kinase
MELLEGQTLQRHLAGKALKTKELLELGIQIASVLEAARARGIIHREIKPANIFITKSGQMASRHWGNSTGGMEMHVDMKAVSCRNFGLRLRSSRAVFLS